ncbi:hydroxypyruvate isomerase-like protein Gip isoform X2 [Oratosquilla oratoria]|uniref:hydroxypyruvate isomerase-like protein Gip isoform X2 n=1 Tax=Oratosquilla oratoria TaxID=337810 RepID=UPI003F759CAB
MDGVTGDILSTAYILPIKMPLRAVANLSFMFTEAGPLVARYEAARACGFKVVECAFPYVHSIEEVVEALQKSGLQQVLINSDPGDVQSGELGFAAKPGQEEKFRDSLERSIAYAKALKCGKIHVMSGKHSQEKENSSLILSTFEANLRHAASRFEAEGLVGLIEPINPVSIPGYILNDYQTAIDLLKKVDSSHLRLQLDIFHLQMITGNVTNNIKALMPFVGHVQVAQAPHRHEPGSEGELNYDYVFKVLQEEGYTDFVGAEYVPSSSTPKSLNWISQYGLTF